MVSPDSKVVNSVHPDLDIPAVTLPRLLLQLDAPLSTESHFTEPIFYPAPNAARVLAKKGIHDAAAPPLPAATENGHHVNGNGSALNTLKSLAKELPAKVSAAVKKNGTAAPAEVEPLDFDTTGPVGLLQARAIAERVAVSLLSSFPGWKKGDVVAFYSANQHDYCAAVLGVQMAGGIGALCNPSYKPWELATQLRKIKPKIIIATAETYEAAKEATQTAAGPPAEEEVEKLGSTEEATLYVFDETHPASWVEPLLSPPKDAWARKEELLAEVKIDPHKDAAVYCFSSGTSGLPKALALTHYNLVANCLQLHKLLDDEFNPPLKDRKATDKFKSFHVDVLPCFHAYGLQVQLVALYSGSPRVVLGRFNLQIFLELVEQKKVTFSFLVPPILLALAKHPDVAKHDLSSLTRVVSGAAILSRALAKQVHDRLGIVITDGYGMSEMSPVVCCQNPKDVEEEPESIGFLTPNTYARIVNEKGEDVPRGEEGELWLQGPQMMRGYIGNEAANKECFTADRSSKDCWLRTGDTAKISPAGRLTLTGRTKDLIKMSGFQVSPKELEDLLFRLTLIADAAVVGVREEDGSEIPWAFLVPSKEAAVLSDNERNAAVLDAINPKVAGYKKIKGITWLEALPKSESGKVLKRKLERPLPAL